MVDCSRSSIKEEEAIVDVVVQEAIIMPIKGVGQLTYRTGPLLLVLLQ
jgi:hypothetical protein